ncbi:hypothetical protein [Candidatus Nitrosocosmicus hydrocola]|uniref:hypothetical protein n=1 Tax=Candidatus Nitrosocosmicus hydrocola TaxID=1826872 RepID=UPI0011E5A87D|nr:hypothetical protein [Candidatus Nitrosocosmicus hydrocola]
MKSLAALSKFSGSYDIWLELIKKHNLRWSNGNGALHTIKKIFDQNSSDIKSMIDWIRKVSAVLPEQYQNVLLFNTLTGRRPDEPQKAIWLIKTKESEYVDKE